MINIKIYHNEEINDLDELVAIMKGAVPACYDPPEKTRCICKNCFEYEITIEKINEKKM